jgi:LysM repeat protein
MTRHFFLFFLAAAALLSARQSSFYSDAALDELRLELSDVKHELHSARVEIQLLEEKIAKQDRALANPEGAKHLDALSKKIDRLEKTLDKAMGDVRSLSAQENKAIGRLQEIESALVHQEKKFEEIAKLKTLLGSISKEKEKSRSYHVKSGDSLEKIARANNTTVDAIRRLNQLASDKIIIGQELKICSDER